MEDEHLKAERAAVLLDSMGSLLRARCSGNTNGLALCLTPAFQEGHRLMPNKIFFCSTESKPRGTWLGQASSQTLGLHQVSGRAA